MAVDAVHRLVPDRLYLLSPLMLEGVLFLQMFREKGDPWVLQIDVARAMGFNEPEYGTGVMAPTGHHFNPEFMTVLNPLKERGWIIHDTTDTERPEWRLRLSPSGLEKIDELESEPPLSPPEPTPKPGAFPSWGGAVGVVFGSGTILFFMGLVVTSIVGRSVPPDSRFLVVVVLALATQSHSASQVASRRSS